MQSNQIGKSLNTNYGYGLPPGSKAQAKYDGQSPGGGADMATLNRQWVETNRYIYDQIMSGASPLNPQDTDLFMQYWSYASQAMMGSGWGDPMGGGYTNGAYPPGQGQGPMGNQFYNNETAVINTTGQGITHDSFSFENTINVPSTNIEVRHEIKQDTRFVPSVEVLVVIMRDKFTEIEEVATFANFRDPDFKLTINTVLGKGVDFTAIDDVDLTIGEFDPNAASGGNVADAQAMVDNIQGASERTGDVDTQMLNHLSNAGFEFATIEDLKKAIEDGTFPPALGTDAYENSEILGQLLEFLNSFDTTMQGLWTKMNSPEFAELSEAEKNEIRTEYGEYASSVLHMMYPGHTFDPGENPFTFKIDGQSYLWFSDSDENVRVASGDIDLIGDLNPLFQDNDPPEPPEEPDENYHPPGHTDSSNTAPGDNE